MVGVAPLHMPRRPSSRKMVTAQWMGFCVCVGGGGMGVLCVCVCVCVWGGGGMGFCVCVCVWGGGGERGAQGRRIRLWFGDLD